MGSSVAPGSLRALVFETVSADHRGRRVTAPTTGKGAPVDASYNARHLLVLEGLEAVRKRPGMYVGSTDTRGLMQCLREIVDNAVDGAPADVCDRTVVTPHPHGAPQARANRRGGAVDNEPKPGR